MDMTSYNKILGMHGTSTRDRVVYNAKRDAEVKGPQSPAYKTVEIDGVKHAIEIISTTIANAKTIRSMPGDDFTPGSIVLWSGSHWLITERDADDEITVRGRIEQCKRQVVWQNPATHTILSRWATVDKPYFSNLSENKMLSISSREFKLQMPYDDETAQLDVGKRLMLEIIGGNPKTYRVTCIDQMTERLDRNNALIGFIVINVEQDMYNPETNNKEMMICDYIKDNSGTAAPPVEQQDAGLTIKYSGDPLVRCGGLGKYFTAYSGDVLYEQCIWAIAGTGVPDRVYLGSKLTSTTGSRCKVTCTDDKSLIGTKLTLTATKDGVSTSVEVEVVAI